MATNKRMPAVEVPSVRPVSESSRISRLSENSIRIQSSVQRSDKKKKHFEEEELVSLYECHRIGGRGIWGR